jgi:uncharacterized protein (DUF302 family)
VKRTLDGLHQKVELLSNEVTSNDAVIQAHGKITMDKNDEKTAADEKHARDIEECKNIRDSDQSQVDQFQKELDELTNIANPTVRSKIKFDTDMAKDVKEHVETLKNDWEAENNGDISEEKHQKILQEAGVKPAEALAAMNASFAAMNLTQCQKAAAFLQASTRVKSRVTTIMSIDDCDKQRQQLQDEFANAFIQITQLRDSTSQRITEAHEDCIALADGTKDETHERLDSQIQESTNAINRAQELLNALNPLWVDAKKGLKKAPCGSLLCSLWLFLFLFLRFSREKANST